MDARFFTAGDPVIGHIETLPVNAAHRTYAHAHYGAAEKSVGRMLTLLAKIQTFVVACRHALRIRKRVPLTVRFGGSSCPFGGRLQISLPKRRAAQKD